MGPPAGLAAALLGACAAVDAAPTLGADVGGGLALMPSAVVVVLMLARVRLTGRRLVATVAILPDATARPFALNHN